MNVQPARDLCVALCVACVVASVGCAYWSGTLSSPTGLVELAVVFAILAETYAKD